MAWGTAAAAFSVLMALSRAYLGAHWLSDAIAGVLLGASCALLAALAVSVLQRRWGARPARPFGPSARPGYRPPSGPAMSSPPVAVTVAGRLPASSRYRHPGDVIRLISAALLLACSLVRLMGRASGGFSARPRPCPSGLGPAGRVITGLVQVACLAAVAVVVAATLRRRRFRLLAGLAAGAVAAAILAAGIFLLIGGQRPAALTAHLARGSWLAGAAFPAPALFASAAAVVVAAAPWLSRPWRRAAWLTLLLAAVARLLTGTALPMQLILALATGVTVGAAVLVAFGVPDRRIGPAGSRPRCGDAGLPVTSVRPAEVETKGSRKFAAVSADGRRLFVKALGSDQRDADLLYRAYRAVRLRNVGDTRPAASLFQAVERQALAGVMAERAGVSVPGVDRIVRAGDTALLVMELVDGCSLDRLPAEQVGDDLLARLWAEVGTLHRAGIAHRSLRAANVMVSPAGQPRIVDFSFSELAATQRQMDLDVAELLASLATLAGRGPGRVRRRRRASAPRGWPGRCRCCSRWPCPPPPAARSRARTACSRGPGPRPPPPAARRRRTWPACSACGPGPCSPSPPRPERSTSCCPSWPRWGAAGTPCSRRTGSGCPWSSPSRR